MNEQKRYFYASRVSFAAWLNNWAGVGILSCNAEDYSIWIKNEAS